MRLLVIEDEEDLASAVGEHLRAHGHAVDIAHDLDMAEAATQVAEFDLILRDLHLPDRDGLTFLRNLRGADRHRARPDNRADRGA